MKSNIQCFMLDPTEEAQEELRRYVCDVNSSCPLPHGYHDTSVEIGTCILSDSDINGRGSDDFDHSDSRWPITCACGYLFQPGDLWQHNTYRLYRRSDNGELTTLKDAPVGAMWFAPWYLPVYKGPDGNCLVVKTPGGDWLLDGPTDKQRWTRTGVPPLVTASPSILFYNKDHKPAYHGWLRNGRLEEC